MNSLFFFLILFLSPFYSAQADSNLISCKIFKFTTCMGALNCKSRDRNQGDRGVSIIFDFDKRKIKTCDEFTKNDCLNTEYESISIHKSNDKTIVIIPDEYSKEKNADSFGYFRYFKNNKTLEKIHSHGLLDTAVHSVYLDKAKCVELNK